MTTDIFTPKQFEQALDEALKGTNLLWSQEGWIGGELHYSILAKQVGKTPIYIHINSSITRSGVAADTGQNSIRVWFSDDKGLPLGNKTQRWTTRMPGWEGRLKVQLDKVINMVKAVNLCKTCGKIEKVFITKKEGPNKGRFFKKCNDGHNFQWLDEYEQTGDEMVKPAAQPVVNGDFPRCPQCCGEMVLRSRKSDGEKFYGCKAFPNCRGTQPFISEATKAFVKANDPIAAVKELRAKPKTFSPTYEQVDIFQKVQKLTLHLVLEALAGTGKTTTAVKMLDHLHRGASVLFCAYNAHIKDALKKKIKRFGVRVSTYHGIGYGAILNTFGKDVIVDDDKLAKIVKQMIMPEAFQAVFPTISQLVSLLKAELLPADDESMDYLADYHGIPLNGDRDFIYTITKAAMKASLELTGMIDYDDMPWFPIIMDLPLRQYDYVIIDEAQDTNRGQLELALRSVKPTGRIIAVGDRNQSIYAFRGADANSMTNIIDRLQAETLPLSITFRNPLSHVRLVNETFPEIPLKAADWAEEGIIRDISYRMLSGELQSGDLVLCRVNAPLVPVAFSLIRRGVKAVIRGRNIGSGLIALIKKTKCEDVLSLVERLTEYKNLEVSKLLKADKKSQAQTLEDRVETIIALSDGLTLSSDVIDRIKQIFDDNSVEAVVFSSIHRAKGEEADRVFLMKPDLMPHPYAEKEWELVQERNIQYVAYTRSRHELVFVRE
jgi:DNA helicase-2/ATP-dependent DNA helicase PcrA